MFAAMRDDGRAKLADQLSNLVADAEFLLNSVYFNNLEEATGIIGDMRGALNAIEKDIKEATKPVVSES